MKGHKNKSLREREHPQTESIDDGCQQIMETLLKDGFNYQVPRKEVENAIIKSNMGMDERTWKRWIRALTVMEYLIPANNQVYEMNVVKIPHLYKLFRNIAHTPLETRSLSQTISEEERKE